MEMEPEEILLEAEDRMDQSIVALQRELGGIRTGRAHPSLVELLQVEHYGQQQPLKQLATIGTPEARLISIQVWLESFRRWTANTSSHTCTHRRKKKGFSTCCSSKS